HRPDVVVQSALGAEVLEDAGGDAVRELEALRTVGEEPAERADDRVHRLAAERRQPVDQDDLATQRRSFQRGRGAGDAGTQHADIGSLLHWRGGFFAPHGADRNFLLVAIGHRYSNLMLFSRTVRVHASHCALWNAASSSGVEGRAAKPWRSNCSRLSGFSSTAFTARLRRVLSSAGILAGANSAAHGSMVRPRMPASAAVGTSGRSGLRASSSVASTRTRPSRASGGTPVPVPNIIWMRSVIRSLSAAASPL